MKAIIFFCLCIAAVNCGVYRDRRDRPDFDCPRWCTRKGYSPICSTEGKTFDNDCFLECNWHYKACDGRCPCYRPPRPDPPVQYCYCDPKWDPVCTTDGTESSECVAKCKGKFVIYDGQCID